MALRRAAASYIRIGHCRRPGVVLSESALVPIAVRVAHISTRPGKRAVEKPIPVLGASWRTSTRQFTSQPAAPGEGAAASSPPSTSSEPPHFKLLLPDMGQTTKSGTVIAWRKAEGEFIKNGDILCEVEMDQFTVGMEIADKGYLARILVPAGTKDVPIGEALAILVYDDQHVDAFHAVPVYHPPPPPTDTPATPPEHHPSGVDVLKFLHKLTKSGAIKDKEFERKLMALARTEKPELLRVFEASFEGPERTEENFDLEFFLENAHGIVEDEQHKP